MIVDTHTQLWDAPEQLGPAVARQLRRRADSPWEQPDSSTTAFDAAMQTVDVAIILGFQSRMLEANVSPQQVARYVARHPAKHLGFAGLDPLDPGCFDALDQAVDLGLVGVVVSPAAAGFHPSHTRAFRLYERCVELGLPLVFDSAVNLATATKMEFAQPYLLDEIARTLPDLKLVIAQVGHPWFDQTLVMIGKHANVYASLSDVIGRPWQLYNVLASAHQLGVISRLLLGSHFPFSTPERVISTIYSVNSFSQGTHLPSVPREQLRSIVERDALASLGLTPPTGRAPARPAPAAPAAEPDPVSESPAAPAPSSSSAAPGTPSGPGAPAIEGGGA